MTTLVFCNIGNRDVRVDGERGPYPPARVHGEQLLKEWKQVENQVAFPIIEPALSYLWKQHDDRLDLLVLIGTDQGDDQSDVLGIPFRDKDTYNYAELIRRVLQSRYGQPKFGRILTKKVTMNPSLYDEAFDHYGRLMAGFAEEGIETCYVVPVGGTPACNTALLLQGVRLFGERCRTVYVPENVEPYELQAGRRVMDVMREQTAVEMLQRFDFAAAYPLLEHRQAPLPLLALVQYGSSRLSFDFDTAQRHLEDAINHGSGETRRFAQTIRHDLDALHEENELALIGEVYQNARICWQNGRYVDFLGRVFRLQEAVLRFLIQQRYGVGTDHRKNKEAMIAYIEARPHLHQFIGQQTRQGEPLDYDEINIPLLLALAQHMVETGLAGNPAAVLADSERQQVQTIYPILRRIEDLTRLRNKSIVAHGYLGISQTIILQEYNKNSGGSFDPLADLAAVCGALGIALDNPFGKVVDFIIAQLRHG